MTINIFFATNKNKDKEYGTSNKGNKKVFAQELEPLGYVMLKGKYPYFVKVVTPEIINVITIKKDKYFTLRFSGKTKSI